MISVHEILEEYGIKYYTHGENVASGWVGITCPFCSDRTNHMGINLSEHYFSCWKCNTKGKNFLYVISVITGIKFKELIKKYPEIEKKIKEGFTGGSVPLFNTYTLLHNMAHEYLLSDSRKFTDQEIHKLEKEYKILFILDGNYSNRLFIPIIEDGYEINFLARSVSGDKLRYVNASEAQCVKPLSDCLYGIDFIKTIEKADILFLQEGIFDSLKINLTYHHSKCYSIPLFKKILHREFSRNSDLMKLSTHFKKVVILLDYGEISASYKLYSDLKDLIPNLTISFLPENIKDIGSLSGDEVLEFLHDVKKGILNE